MILSQYEIGVRIVREGISHILGVTYKVISWGDGGTAPSLNYPGDPPEPPEIELLRVVQEAPRWAEGKWPQDEIIFALTHKEEQTIWEQCLEDLAMRGRQPL